MKTALSMTTAFFLAAVLSVPASSQSLGDVARQGQANGAKKSKLVVTDDDLPPSSDAATATNDRDAEAKDGNKEGDANTAKNDSLALSKTPSKENVAVLKAKISDLKEKQQEYQISIAQLEEKLQNAESDFRAQTYREALENGRHSLKLITEQRESAEQALAAVQQQMKQGTDTKPAAN